MIDWEPVGRQLVVRAPSEARTALMSLSTMRGNGFDLASCTMRKSRGAKHLSDMAKRDGERSSTRGGAK